MKLFNIFISICTFFLQSAYADSIAHGTKYLPICSIKGDRSSDEAHCKKILQSAVMSTDAMRFCDDTSSTPGMKRLCYMVIADKKFTKSELDRCRAPTSAAPPAACIENVSSESLAYLSGSKYMNVCAVKGDRSSDEAHCKKILQSAVMSADAMRFCDDTSSTLGMKRICYMAIADKKFTKSELDRCRAPISAAPPAACIENIQARKTISKGESSKLQENQSVEFEDAKRAD